MTRPSYHPYLGSTTAGYVIIEGVRAAKVVAPVATSDSWAALGSFEGGQAVWAANELIDNYGSGLDLVATASLSPLADFEGLADAAMAGTLTPERKLVFAVVGSGGSHDFTSAGKAFATALPWLAARLGTPGALPQSLPGAP